MNQLHKLLRWAWSILVVCTLAFAMGGCEGDDGAQGPPGADGADGTNGTDGADGADALVIPLESCGVCHGTESFADAVTAHALDPIESVRNVEVAVVDADLVVTFDLYVDDVLTAGYNNPQRGYRNDGTTRTTITDDLSLEDLGGGSYAMTVAGGAAQADTPNRYLFRVYIGEDRTTRVYFYADFPVSPFGPQAVSGPACESCHGPEGINVHGGKTFQAADGIEPCRVCHDGNSAGPIAVRVHQYHAGHRDPITYPTYMTNCSVCHSPDEIVVDELTQLAAANSMPVSGVGCLSCHGEMDNEYWNFEGGLSFHLTNITDPLTYDCQTQCHEPTGAAQTKVVVTQFHNGIETERHGWILDGEDASLTEGALFDWRITGVEVIDDGANLAVSWAADYGDPAAGVDPCNDTVAAGEPVFFLGPNLEEMTMYRNYAQGDDFLLGPGSSPGAPSSVDLDATNTTCQDGIATTVLAVDAVTAMKGRVALGGKPLVVAPEGLAGLPGVPAVIEARVPTPTFDFLLADGSAAPARRAVVDTGKCLGCHVGSLYQHGGDRVDNVDMCLMCHNVASNEQNVREGMGLVDAADTYDGKVGETYGMKTMLHRVHSANWEFKGDRFNAPYLVYRNRGIYAFAKEGDFPPNWDTGAACTDRYGRPGTIVSGADPALTTACQVHNFEAPTFPRSLNECAACHDAKFASVIPDQMIAMATTVEAGAAPWNVYLDDVLQGAATTACITCHYSSSTKGHAYLNSWAPQEFPEGRQTIIDAVN